MKTADKHLTDDVFNHPIPDYLNSKTLLNKDGIRVSKIVIPKNRIDINEWFNKFEVI